MTQSNRSTTIYQAMLMLPFLVLLINHYELTFLVWSLTALVSLRQSYSAAFLRLIVISAAILLLGAVAMIGESPEPFNVFRDVAYLTKPILGMLIGYHFCRILGKNIWKTLIDVGFLLAVYHIGVLIFSYVFIGIRNMHILRQFGGYFDDFQVYILILLIFRKQLGIEVNEKRVPLLLTIIGLSSFLYLSRVNIIQFVILFVAMKGYLRPTVRSIRVVTISMALVLAAYGAVYYSNPSRSGKGLEAFLYKIKIAPIEPFKTKINKEDWKDFHDNYRSFENIITVKQLESHDAFWTGMGLGSTIDLGREVWTNDGEFIRYIPILHNSYYTVWFKAGMLAMVLMFVFIYYLYKPLSALTDEIRHFNYLLMGSAIYLIFSNWVFMGLYLKLDNKSIILGAILCYRFYLYKQAKESL